MARAKRVTPQDIYEKVRTGGTVLVCAYADDFSFRSMHLEGAISLAEFERRLPDYPKDREIVFYCA